MKIKKIIFSLFLAVAIFLFWGGYIEPELLTVNNINLKIPHWHQENNNLKFVVLSDLHIGCKGGSLKRISYIIDQINKQKPDIVLLLGDYAADSISLTKVDRNKIIKEFKRIKAPLGVVAILGNHDYYPDIMRSIIKESGFTLLEDDVIRIKDNGKSFYIAGIKDIWHYYPDLKKINNKIPKNQPAIMLAHNPDIFPEISEKFGLTLSGHNHGGVIYIPYFAGLLVPSEYGQRYLKGHIVEGNKQLFVSTGIGTNTILRIGNTPEILVLNLKNSNKNEKLLNTPKKPFENFNLVNYSSYIVMPFKFINKIFRFIF